MANNTNNFLQVCHGKVLCKYVTNDSGSISLENHTICNVVQTNIFTVLWNLQSN